MRKASLTIAGGVNLPKKFLRNTFIVILMLNLVLNAQSLTGMSGYFRTPDAYTVEDGTLAFGAALFNKNYQQYSNYQNDVLGVFATLGYIPRTELSLRITRKINADYTSHVMDRMFSAKFILIEEGNIIPNVACGLQNPYSTVTSANHFNSTYFVLSKKINFSKSIISSITLGRGFDWIKSADHEFIGYFGGLSITLQEVLISKISFIVEYDAERWNGGIRLLLFNHLALLAGYQGFNAFSGNFSILFSL